MVTSEDQGPRTNENSSVLISIVNWDGRMLLEGCLQSLFNRTDSSDFDVVVVDNGSNDGSVEMVQSEFPTVEIIVNEKNRGFAKAHNQAIKFALDQEYEYILLLNNDTVITNHDWLEELISVMEANTEIGVCGCTVVEPDGEIHYDGRYYPISSFLFPTLKEKYEYNRFEEERTDEGSWEYVDDVVGAVFLIRLSIVNKVGLLDEAYSPAYYEESDFCVRVWDAGYKVAHTKRTKLVHQRHQTTKKLNSVKKEYFTHRNRIRFILLNYPLKWVFACIPFLLLQTLQLPLKRTERGFIIRDDFKCNPFRSMFYLPRVYVEIFRALPEILQKRTRRSDVCSMLK